MPASLRRVDYPAMYLAASEKSKSGETNFTRATVLRLAALLVAAVGGAASWSVRGGDLFGWVALLAFLVALGAESYILAARPEREWYEGRAAAESVKTLAWRYAIGGNPFAASVPPGEADQLLLQRLDDLLFDLASLAIPPVGPSDQITNQMRSLRLSPYSDRKQAYAEGRVREQRDWYGRRARENDRSAHLFLTLSIAFEIIGVVGAALKAMAILDIDLLGILAAAAAGLVAWSQTRQYGLNARAYSIASHELASISSELRDVPEERWAEFVGDAEEAISREHTLWRASKGITLQAPRSR